MHILRVISKILISWPFLAVANLLIGVSGIAAVLLMDPTAYPSCDIEKLFSILVQDFGTLSAITSETAVKLRLAEWGLPDVIGLSFVPAVLVLLWFYKVIAMEKEVAVWAVNAVITLVSVTGLMLGFVVKSGQWLDVERAKANIWERRHFIEHVKWDALALAERYPRPPQSPNITACSIALELHAAIKLGFCGEDESMEQCYAGLSSNSGSMRRVRVSVSEALFEN